jgi:hypothetical protein
MEEPFNQTLDQLFSEREQVAAMFNENTQIDRLSEGEFKVSTTLADGIAEGGQKVEIIMKKQLVEELLPLLLKDKSGKTPQPMAYRVTKMAVNGKQFLKDDEPFYLDPNLPGEPVFRIDQEEKQKIIDSLPPPPPFLFWEPSSDEDSHPTPGLEPLPNHWGGACAIATAGIILMSEIKTGDSLLAILHERGHLSDTPNKPVLGKIRAEFTATIDRNAELREQKQDVLPTFRETQTFLSLLYEEVRADKFALYELTAMRNQGNDLFPNDLDFVRARKSLTVPLMTYLQVDPDLRKSIGSKANSILNY